MAGREFKDFKDINKQAQEWCEQKNALFSRKLHASRRELFAAECPSLTPLPVWAPEVYRLYYRIVDVSGYVQINSNKYSAPWKLIGRQLEIRETKEKIEIFEGPRMVATHEQSLGSGALATQREHRPPRGQSKHIFEVNPDEEALLKIEPRISGYVEAIKKQTRIRTSLALRHLLRMLQDYPRESFLTSVQLAEKYKLFDLERLEKMVLKRIATDYFILPPGEDEDE